jgi:hypothetical protein
MLVNQEDFLNTVEEVYSGWHLKFFLENLMEEEVISGLSDAQF